MKSIPVAHLPQLQFVYGVIKAFGVPKKQGKGVDDVLFPLQGQGCPESSHQHFVITR
jgi:hypothetical protein